jgi:hypothetical protein
VYHGCWDSNTQKPSLCDPRFLSLARCRTLHPAVWIFVPHPQLLFGCTRSKGVSCRIRIRAQDGPPPPITQVKSHIFLRIFKQTMMKGILGTTILQPQDILDNRLTPEIPFPRLPWVPTSTPPMSVSTIAAIWLPRGQTPPRVTRIRACRAQTMQPLHRPDMNTRSRTTPQALV